jgi:hypothetical protein
LRWYNRNDKKMLTEKKFTINSLEWRTVQFQFSGNQ